MVAAAVNDAKDVTEDPHFAERTLVDLANTVFGTALMPGPILHMNDYARPDVRRRPDHRASTPARCWSATWVSPRRGRASPSAACQR